MIGKEAESETVEVSVSDNTRSKCVDETSYDV
jgi:hypothetical protein